MSLRDEIDKRTQERLKQVEVEEAARLNRIRQEHLQLVKEALANAGSAKQTLLGAGVIPLFREVADVYGIEADEIKLMWEAGSSLCENLQQVQEVLVTKQPSQTYQSAYGAVGKGPVGTLYYDLKAIVEVKDVMYGQDARRIRAEVDTSLPQILRVTAGKEEVYGQGNKSNRVLRDRVNIELNGTDPLLTTRLSSVVVDIIAEGKDRLPWDYPHEDTTFG